MHSGGSRTWLVTVFAWAAMFVWLKQRMSGIPVYQLAVLASAVATQLLPTLTALSLPRPVLPARFWIGVWAAFYFVSDLLQFVISDIMGSNLWYYVFADPVSDAAFLWAFSHWQSRPVMKLTFRVAIPVLAIGTIAIALYFGEVNGFKALSHPFRLLVLTVASVYTLLERALRDPVNSRDRDWFWVSLGALLYHAAFVAVEPVANALSSDMPLLQLVYVVKAAVDTLAFVLIWIGMRCPVETTSSASFSEPSLRSG